MYIQRHIDADLLDWKGDNERKPLLIRGARQVGKSSTIKHFGESFDYYIEVNLEKHPEAISLFTQHSDVHLLAESIGLMFNTPVIPGKTLLFIDEIQASQEAIKSLWFFKEDYPELHVVAAGSLLEFTLKEISSFGVGRIRSMFLYPFSFDEFLMASGQDMWLDAKKKADCEHPLLDILHNELVKVYRTYLIVGGMPASVSAWIKHHSYLKCRAELNDIQHTYYDDFPKYAAVTDPSLLRNTLNSVIKQMGGKFIFSKVEGEYKTAEVKKALALLCDAGLIRRVSLTAANGIPLGAETNGKFAKYIFLDSGLLLSILDMDLKEEGNMTDLVIVGAADELVNKGGLAEMMLGWEMIKYSSPQKRAELYYWENTDNGATSEVDYIITKNMQVLPVECKAGTSGKMKSLWLFMRKKHLTSAIRCSLENFSTLTQTDAQDGDTERKISIIPLYAVSNLTF